MKQEQRCITELAGILQILYGEVAVHISRDKGRRELTSIRVLAAGSHDLLQLINK